MRIFYWMISVVNWSKLNQQNSEHSSLFLFVPKALLVMLLLSLFSACQPSDDQNQNVVFTGPIMGTEYRISAVINGQVDQDQLRQSIVAAMESVNQSMSNYIEDSEVSQFNRLEANVPYEMSDDFAAVMKESQRISQLSDGAFDVTLAKAINAWGFGPNGTIKQQPTNQKLEVLKNTVGHQKLIIEGNTLSKTIGDVEVSLSAIAKGYAVDKVADAMKTKGVLNFLVNIGGELRASGKSVDGHVWRVGIEKPHILGGIQQIALLKDKAIATSGDYRNYLLVDGEQFSHTIDPVSLKPVLHKLALVSVISDNASTADALATALMVMGQDKAWDFANKHNLATYFIVRNAGSNKDSKESFKIKYTQEFNAYLQ